MFCLSLSVEKLFNLFHLTGESPLGVKFCGFWEFESFSKVCEIANQKALACGKPRRLKRQTYKSVEPFGLWTKKKKTTEFAKSSASYQSNHSQPIIIYFGICTPVGHETTGANLFVPGHVVSELRWMRFSGYPFEWDMAYNNLPSTTVQTVKDRLSS
jgi:hypothetical protein